jgi:hypothetical protein
MGVWFWHDINIVVDKKDLPSGEKFINNINLRLDDEN